MNGQDWVHLLTGSLFLVLALLVGRCPAQLEAVSGLKPLDVPGVEGLERPSEATVESAGPFFEERNVVRFRVPRTMAAQDLLELYQIDFRHIREQIAAQVGLERFDPRFEVQEGTELELRLTPPEDMFGGTETQ